MKNPDKCSSFRQLGLEIPDRDHTYRPRWVNP